MRSASNCFWQTDATIYCLRHARHLVPDVASNGHLVGSSLPGTTSVATPCSAPRCWRDPVQRHRGGFWREHRAPRGHAFRHADYRQRGAFSASAEAVRISRRTVVLTASTPARNLDMRRSPNVCGCANCSRGAARGARLRQAMRHPDARFEVSSHVNTLSPIQGRCCAEDVAARLTGVSGENGIAAGSAA